MLQAERLKQALATLGALLQERRQRVGVLVVGGSSLLLLGVIDRPTADVDVVGFSSPAGYRKVDAFPTFLATAVREVGEAFGLGEAWFNSGPADLIEFGLPAGLEDRVTILNFGGLEVHLPAPEDLVCFKLYAAVDQGERSKHFADLRALAPTAEQLVRAAVWAMTHDPSAGFLVELRRILELFGVELPNGHN